MERNSEETRLDRSTLLGWAAMLGLGGLSAVSSGSALVGALIVASILVATAAPTGALYATCAAIPLIFHPVEVGSLRLGLLELGIVVTTVGTAIRVVFDAVESRQHDRSSWPNHDRILLLPISLALVGTASLLWMPFGSHLGEAMRTWRWLIIEPVLLFFLARRAITSDGSRWLVVAIALPAVAVAGAAIVQIADSTSNFAVDDVHRSTSVYLHPNNLALYLERVFMLVLVPTVYLRGRLRWVFFGMSIVLLVGLVSTFSRGAMAGILLGSIVGLIARPVRHGWRYLATMTLGTVAAFALLAGARFRGAESSGLVSTREILWTDSLHMLRDFPLTGIGLDQFLWMHQRRYIDPRIWTERYTSHPHNVLLDSWLSLGIPGLLLLLLFIAAGVQLLWSIRRRRRDVTPWQLGALASLAAGLGHGLVDNSYFLPDLAAMTWLCIALVSTSTTDSMRAPDD